MQYQHNVHFLLPIQKFEELKNVSRERDIPRSEIVREGLDLVLQKYDSNGEKKSS